MPDTLTVKPYKFNGQIKAMCSKSYLQRALALSSLASGDSKLTQVQWSADGLAAADVITQLGSSVKEGNQSLLIKPNEVCLDKSVLLNIGESGLGLRMFSGLAALKDSTIKLIGKGSILDRPVTPVLKTLEACGVKVKAENNSLPLSITGPLKGGEYHVDGSFSSQIITGLLISLPLAHGDTTLHVKDLKSIPYVDMTLELVHLWGGEIIHDNYKKFKIKGNQTYAGTNYAVEGDWSGMANHLVGAAISGEITVTGLNSKSLQADRAILTALEKTGAGIKWDGDKVTVTQKENKPFNLDATHSPDIFPPLVVLACAANGVSRIKGTHRLTHKESDRLTALIDTFKKLGVTLTTENDELLIHGVGHLHGATLHSYNDHRIAMAAFIAASISDSSITIEQPDAVKKSYPNFYAQLSYLQ